MLSLNDFSFSWKKTHFHKKDCALGLILKVRVFGTRKWAMSFHNYILQREYVNCSTSRSSEVGSTQYTVGRKGIKAIGKKICKLKKTYAI